jgi:hypothetical protein
MTLIWQKVGYDAKISDNSKNKQVGLCQTERLLCSTENNQQKTSSFFTYCEKKICEPYIWQKVNTQTIKGIYTTQ